MRYRWALAIIVASILLVPLVCADISFPTVTRVYFEKDGQLYDKPVSFKVECYGYSFSPGEGVRKESGTYTPSVVFGFSANVQKYGDKIYEDYYMNYRHIDYCNIKGETSEGNFSIGNFSKYPYSKCKDGGQPNEKDNEGSDVMVSCELKVDIGQNTSSESEPQGFWSKISCFFKKLFGESC